MDCRINAYPSVTSFNGLNMTPISFIMIDLDLTTFAYSKEKLDRVLTKSLRKIHGMIEGRPTILWTGNGYHIYQPVTGYILEEFRELYDLAVPLENDLTSVFIRFAEEFLTDNRCDPQHRPTVKSCLIRIPGSINSKCMQRTKLLQMWDGHRPPITNLLRDFRRYLIQKKINKFVEEKRKERTRCRFKSHDIHNGTKKIRWIETLLQSSCSDHRKYCIWRILVPYLINIRRCSSEDAFVIIDEWLDNCDKVERLDFDSQTIVKDTIKRVGNYRPISLDNLRKENRELFDIVSR